MLAAAVSATLVDSLEVGGDTDGDGVVDPGETITYRATLTETGGEDAVNVMFAVTLDPNTTLVANSVKITPIALDDAFALVGNTPLTVNAANGLLLNDIDIDSTTPFSNVGLTVVTAGITDIGGTAGVSGSLVANADGSFTYTPGTGATGTDIFSYQIVDPDNLNNVTAGFVTFTISDPVWYVDSAAAAGGDGSFNNPFQSLAPLNGAGGAGDVDAAGSRIFVFESGTAYTTGIELESNQQLIGESVGLMVNGLSIGGSGSNPTISNGAGHGIMLASGNTLRGLTIGNTSGAGLFGNNFGTLNADTITINGTGQILNLTTGTLNSISFTSLSTTSSGSTGISLSSVGGSFTAGAGSSISGTTGAAVDISGGTVGMTFNGNITQANNAALVSIANHATGTITFQNGTLSATNGSGLQFNNADSTSSYNFNGTTTLSGGDAGIDIIGGSSGTFSFGGGTTITNPSGTAFNLNGSNANVTYSGGISKTSAGLLIDIDNHDSGTVTFQTGTLSSTGSSSGLRVQNSNGGTVNFNNPIKTLTTGANAAVTLNTNNAGGTVNFGNGGLAISTTSGVGFSATGGGTVTVQGASNTIVSGTGTALNIANTTIGASGLTFQSISANGGTNGIVLNVTGSGGLTVTGTGMTDGSGGTIQNTTGRGASFISASNITLLNMNFTNAGTSDLDPDNSGLSTGDNLATNAAIHLQSVNTVTLDNLNISGGAEQGINGNTVANFTLANSTITDVGNAADEDGIHFFNMSGSSAITNTTITSTVAIPNSTGGDDHFNLQMQSGSLDLVISGGSATNANKGSGYLFGIRGTAIANITFEGATSTNNFSGGIVADAFDSATMNLRVNSSTSSGNNDQLSVSAGDNSRVDLEATGNTLSSVATGDFVVVSLLGSALDSGYVFDARIDGNAITVANGLTADGIILFNAGGGVINTAITNNTIDYAGTQRAIVVQAGQDGSGDTVAEITGNDITMRFDGAGNAVAGMLIQTAITGPGNTSSVDANIGGAGAQANDFTHVGTPGSYGGDIRVRQRNDGTFNLNGYGGAATDTAAVIAYLNGRNNEVVSATATAESTGFTGNATPGFITVSVAPASVLEDGGTNLVYTLTRSGSTASSLVANFTMTGIASAASDFTVIGATTFNTGTGIGTVTFAAGSATAVITIDPTPDADASEFNESVVLDVGNGSFARGVITDDSPLLAASDGVDAAPGSTGGSPEMSGAEIAPEDVGVAGPSNATPIVDDGILTQAELDFLVAAAIERWAAAGLTAEQLATLESATFTVSSMPGWYLGSASGNSIQIDDNAAGLGWFIDATPLDDVEFPDAAAATRLYTTQALAPAGHIDLLTAVLHEMGHLLGLEDSYVLASRDSLMYGFATVGERRLATEGQADGAVPGLIEPEEYMVGPLGLGTLPANKAVQVIFQATVNSLTNGLAPTISAQGEVSGSNIATVMTDDPAVGGAADATDTTLDSLTLGNQVWIETSGNTVFDAGTDTTPNGVTVNLYVDDGDGVLDAGDGAAIATTTTANIGGVDGRYQFDGLLPGDYIVEVVAGTGPLMGTISLSGAPDPDNNVDHDDNGAPVAGFEVASSAITLAYNTEPTAGMGNDTNLTLDFGFIANQPPLATDDAFSTGEDGPVVTANLITGDNGNGADSDADMDPLTLSEVNGSAANVGTQITLASGALLTVNTDGGFTYDPNGQFEGLDDGETDTDTFTYTLSDGAGGTDVATVTVTINGADDAPVATDNANSTDEDTPIGGNVITDDDGFGMDSDVDGDSLSVASITVDGMVLPVGVVHTLNSGATLIVNSDGSYTYDPSGAFDHLGAGETGSETFTYALSDGDGATSTGNVTITITGVNDDPIATDDEFNVGEFGTVSGNLITGNNGNGADADAEGDALTVIEVNGVAANVGTQITLASGALVTVNADGSFTYDPNGQFEFLGEGETATDTFTYTLSDGAGGTDTASAEITIEGLGPRGNIVATFRRGRDVVTLAAPGTLPVDVDIVFTADGVAMIGRNGTTINGLDMLSIDGIDSVKGALGVGNDTVHVTGKADLFTLDLRGGSNSVAFEDFTSRKQTVITSKQGGLDFDAVDSQFVNLVVNAGAFDDSLTFLNVDVLKTTRIDLSGGGSNVTIDDSSFANKFSLASNGADAVLAIEAGLANLATTEFGGPFQYSTGGNATIDISPTDDADETTFRKRATLTAQTPDARLTDANAKYLGGKKLKNVLDL